MDLEEDFYCREVLSGKLSIQKIIENEEVLAFHHTKAYWEEHIVIIPKKHILSICSLEAEDKSLALALMNAIREICRMVETKYGGCRVSSNVGSYQDSKHLHFYVHAGRRLRDEDGKLISKD